jgi:hypothetical protein
MSGNEVRLTDGDRWTWQQFLDQYYQPSASGTPVPVVGRPLPVAVDMPWYMSEGPGRYYHPGMFPIIDSVLGRRDLAPGTYDLWKLAPLNERDPSLKAGIAHYLTDLESGDFKTRAIVFGDESARISGDVVVNPDGTKTFKRVEIRPLDTDFDFRHNNWKRPHIELAREAARRQYDSGSLGTSYDIEYRGHGRLDELGPGRGIGRIYHPFTEAQLSAAGRREFAYPGSMPPGLLPSFTAAPPPAVKEHFQYLNQTSAVPPRVSFDGGAVSPFSCHPGAADWIASIAGIDPKSPVQLQQSLPGASGGTATQQRLLPPWVFFGSR